MSKERSFYQDAIRPVLFRLDPETAHDYTRAVLGLAERSRTIRAALTRMFAFEDPDLEVELWNRVFKNPVGLAAGFDKNAQVVLAMSCLGFGHIEVGAVTRLSQGGNPRPRIFRLTEDQAAINRMGMNNLGAEKVATDLKRSLKERTIPVGVNIASSTRTEEPIADCTSTLEAVYPWADYFVLNVSCPNVEGHRSQQERKFFKSLATQVVAHREVLSGEYGYRPVLVKISPDLASREIDDILEIVEVEGLDGIIATNTTLQKSGLMSQFRSEAGGLSGRPLKQRSTEIIRYIHQQVPVLPIIGVGGVENAQDAWEKMQAGASLVQIFTGMIYEGPFIVKNINQGLVKLMEEGGEKGK